jgi:2-polyprenyl-6-methoxyphenol hydroxylase-like FAD-dependent oxidoreductase
MAASGLTAAVVGGSVGGLFAANMLARRGWRVRVFERVAGGLESRGAGIAMHPELDAILAAAGARPDGPLGIRVAGRTAYDRMGRQIAFHPRPQYLTAWARVFNPLHAAFPAEHYHRGREVVAVATGTAGRAALRFSDGETMEADLVVAADGFRSTVRALLAPEVVPRYAGYVAWRGMVDEAALSAGFRDAVFGRYAFVFPPRSQFIGYPVAGRDESLEPGRRRYNFLWYCPVDEGALADLLTDETGFCHEYSIPPPLIRRAHVEGFRRMAAALLPPPFAEAAARADQIMLQPIYDVESARLVFGRVVLLGDAAFVARPHVGIGVLKAGQDALELACALAGSASIEAALGRYEAARSRAGRDAVRFGRWLGAFIGRRLEAPWSDPGLRLPPERLIAVSATPVERVVGEMPCP